MKLAALVASLVASVLLAAPAPADAHPARERASWAALDVPHVVLAKNGYRLPHAIAMGHGRLPFPAHGIASMAATADGAVVLAQSAQKQLGGQLLELPAHGRAGRVLDQQPLGIPIADPAGHFAFWSHRTPHGAVLMAYDTAGRRLVTGPPLDRDERVEAVDGETAYLSLVPYTGPASEASWTPGEPGLTPLPSVGGSAILSDVSGDRVLVTDFDTGLILTDRTGSSRVVLPDASFGTFSPGGGYVAAYSHRGDVVLFRSDNAVGIPLRGLRGWRTFDYRWAPDGRLVVSALPDDPHAYHGQVPVRFFACTPAEGGCAQLPGGSLRYAEPPFPSTSLGQFLPLADDDPTNRGQAVLPRR